AASRYISYTRTFVSSSFGSRTSNCRVPGSSFRRALCASSKVTTLSLRPGATSIVTTFANFDMTVCLERLEEVQLIPPDPPTRPEGPLLLSATPSPLLSRGRFGSDHLRTLVAQFEKAEQNVVPLRLQLLDAARSDLGMDAVDELLLHLRGQHGGAESLPPSSRDLRYGHGLSFGSACPRRTSYVAGRSCRLSRCCGPRGP